MGTAKRILVIDDEDDIREVAQVGLEVVANWQVITASSGHDGIVKAQTEQPDAILLDVMMPDLDGPTTFRKLQADAGTQHIPVLLLTAKVQTADRRQFADLGVKGVIAKPFDPLKLSAEMCRLLGWDL
jgi:two-component system alkaline phosphatase synthesis response regulator PhoP